jgi:Holliday junction resolvase RusA-like endonuclease
VEALAFLIEAPPGWAAINRKISGRGHKLSDAYLSFREYAQYAVTLAKAKAAQGGEALELPVPWKRIQVQIVCYWPTCYRKGPRAGIPRGDVDAPVKGILDALEHAGVYTDDAHVCGLLVVKLHDPVQPRVEVTLAELHG